MKHRYLVTGATGFVGSWVTRALIQKGEDVSVLVRDKKISRRLVDIQSQLHIYQSDLQSPNLQKLVSKIKPTIILHLAAYGTLPGQSTSPEDIIDTNVKGLVNLINSAKDQKLHLFINTGSSSEYGVKDHPMRETDSMQPINDYGVSKAAATLYAQKVAMTEGMPIVTLRLFSPYGFLDDEKRLVSYVIKNALRNESISLSSKLNVRDFVYIRDVATAYVSTIDKKINPGEIINIGSGKQHSVYDIVKTIMAITKSKSTIIWGSMPQQSRQIEPKIWQADITKARKLLDWKPEYTLEQGLAETVKQYKNL